MHFDAEFYVAVGFLIFVLFLGYQGVHKQLTKALDDRAGRVANELGQAKKLHDEAAALLELVQAQGGSGRSRGGRDRGAGQARGRIDGP